MRVALSQTKNGLPSLFAFFMKSKDKGASRIAQRHSFRPQPVPERGASVGLDSGRSAHRRTQNVVRRIRISDRLGPTRTRVRMTLPARFRSITLTSARSVFRPPFERAPRDRSLRRESDISNEFGVRNRFVM